MRILLWTHNSFALGHLYRTCSIARSIRALSNDDILVVTGARFSFQALLPKSIEVVKLPSFSGRITEKGYEYHPASLSGLSISEITKLRSNLLQSLFQDYWPDIFLVDHQPTGLNGELYGLIYENRLNSGKWKGRLILGTRGVIDNAISGGKYLNKHHGIEVLNQAYNQVLVYSDPRICDFVAEYSLPSTLEKKVNYMGYVNPNAYINQKSDILNKSESINVLEKKLIVVGVGGGRDGYTFIEKAIKILGEIENSLISSMQILIVTGPYMPDNEKKLLEKICLEYLELSDFRIETYLNEYNEILQRSDLFIGMGGYNTLVQIIASKIPALILPRIFPETEQLVHTQKLAKLVDFIFIDDGTKAINELAKVCINLIQLTAPTNDGALNLFGAENTAKFLLSS